MFIDVALTWSWCGLSFPTFLNDENKIKVLKNPQFLLNVKKNIKKMETQLHKHGSSSFPR